MFKLKLTEVIAGNETPIKTNRSSKIVRRLKKTLNASIHSYINLKMVLDPVVTEIRNNLLDDLINNPPKQRQGESPFKHYVTGKLYNNTKSVIRERSPNKISIDFGYFVDYGKNLELGGPRTDEPVKKHKKKKKDRKERNTTAYPIIKPIWDGYKHQVFEQVTQRFLDNFKRKFPNQ